MTFDVQGSILFGRSYNWQRHFEVFSLCRGCRRSTTFILDQREINRELDDAFDKENGLALLKHNLNRWYDVERYVSLRDNIRVEPPEYLSDELKSVFKEAVTCKSVGCYNASATMFRLCLDLVTKPLINNISETAAAAQPNSRTKRDLGLRLAFLFEHGMLSKDLKELAHCVREDANDGAHVGNLEKIDVDDLQDFTVVLLDRLISEPRRLEEARRRRDARRSS